MQGSVLPEPSAGSPPRGQKTYTHTCVYIYIYIDVSISICIFIYIYVSPRIAENPEPSTFSWHYEFVHISPLLKIPSYFCSFLMCGIDSAHSSRFEYRFFVKISLMLPTPRESHTLFSMFPEALVLTWIPLQCPDVFTHLPPFPTTLGCKCLVVRGHNSSFPPHPVSLV